MKIKPVMLLSICAALSIILVLLVFATSATPIRIIAGLPLVLFFPGHALWSAIFAFNKRLELLELITLCFGMSFIVSALIGLALNYTPWGITLNSIGVCIPSWIIGFYAIAIFRHLRHPESTVEESFHLPSFGGSLLNGILSLTVVVAVCTTLGILGYTALNPKIGERFTEFYILDNNGKATSYPTLFLVDRNQTKAVIYGDNVQVNGDLGTLILGIVNQEQKKQTYSVRLDIDGEPAIMRIDDAQSDVIGGITLDSGVKWEKRIGFTPTHVGNSQKAEFKLFVTSQNEPVESVYLWFNVTNIK